MKTPPPHICSTTCHEKCVEKEETGVDCSTASSCDSSPSFLEIYSKKRKSGPPTESRSSGKRLALDCRRDDDPTGVVKQKSDIAESVKCSLDRSGQLNAARLKTWEEDYLHVDIIKQLNDEVFTFVEEVGIGTCVTAIDILLTRKEMAYSWLRWSRRAKLYWLQQYAV